MIEYYFLNVQNHINFMQNYHTYLNNTLKNSKSVSQDFITHFKLEL